MFHGTNALEEMDRGGLIAFNDKIISIYYSPKTNASTPDTFKSIEQGNLGALLSGQPYYFFGAAYPTGRPYFDVTNVTELPSATTLFGHQGFDASLMYAAAANGANFYASFVGAEQARIILQLAIGAGYSVDEIRNLFESPLRNAIYGPSANQHIYYSSYLF
ncbi:hypothetical protein DL764_004006 [Monosporascus ibericus]|uniref:Uncharacterized protein n=1 Tax=Monosporascus ibericus TaxID=155417 RepID=A0A4Q4TG76_9PEZI|nr:hypothetical protein DL764_004006 [Monosporascus ibericus]